MFEWLSKTYVKVGLFLMALPVSMAEASEGGHGGIGGVAFEISSNPDASNDVVNNPWRASLAG